VREDLLQQLQDRIDPDLIEDMRGTRINEHPVRSDFPDETFRIFPAAHRYRRYGEPTYHLDRLLSLQVSTSIRPSLDSPKSPIQRKKHVKRLRRSDEGEMADFVCNPIEPKEVEPKREFRVSGDATSEIDASDSGQKFRVDAGTASFFMGGKVWRVSLGGESYVPRGERTVVASANGPEVVVTELSP
jgi:hypothetical protein